MNPWLLFWLLLKASLFSTSGTGNVPILHHDMLALGWASDHTFAEALAIGQISPGPTGLWVISFAYLVDGIRGALLAVVAIAIPPFTALGVLIFYQRHGQHPAMQGFVRGLTLAVASMFLVVLVRIMHQAGIDWQSLGIAGAACGLTLSKRIPVPFILLLAGGMGILLY
ncbi:MAG: hypothetical protein RL076_2140 [Chloroflexota bacterium]|jgi:chromate transporter